MVGAFWQWLGGFTAEFFQWLGLKLAHEAIGEYRERLAAKERENEALKVENRTKDVEIEKLHAALDELYPDVVREPSLELPA